MINLIPSKTTIADSASLVEQLRLYALKTAINFGSYNIVYYLTKIIGFKPNNQDMKNIFSDSNYKNILYLKNNNLLDDFKEGFNSQFNFYYNETILYGAAELGDFGFVKYLVENGANVNLADRLGATPFFIAIKNEYYDIGEYLLAHGADPSTEKEYNNHKANIYHYLVDIRTQNEEKLLNITLYAPAANGNTALVKNAIKMLDYAYCPPISVPLMKAALKNKQFETAEYIITTLNRDYLRNVFYWAKAEGDLEIIDWLYLNILLKPCRNGDAENIENALWITEIEDIKIIMAKLDIDEKKSLANAIFHPVAKWGYIGLETLKFIMPYIDDVNAKNANNETALYQAAWLYRSEKVTYLLENGAKIHPEKNELHYAIKDWEWEPARILFVHATDANLYDQQQIIENLGYINASDAIKDKLLELAIKSDKPEIVKYFEQSGADINSKINDAFVSESLAVIEYLLHNGATLVLYDKDKNTSILADLITGSKYKSFAWLKAHGYLNHPQIFNEKNSLITQAIYRNYDVAKYFLELDTPATNINAYSSAQKKLLYEALFYKKNSDALKFANDNNIFRFVKEYIDLPLFENKNTALYLMAEYGDLFYAKFLIENGAAIDIANINGSTPFYVSLENGHYEIAEYLLEQGADPNVVNKDYNANILEYARKQNKTETIDWILKHLLLKPLLEKNYDYVKKNMPIFKDENSEDLLEEYLKLNIDNIDEKIFSNPYAQEKGFIDFFNYLNNTNNQTKLEVIGESQNDETN